MEKYMFSTQKGKAYYCNSMLGFIDYQYDGEHEYFCNNAGY